MRSPGEVEDGALEEIVREDERPLQRRQLQTREVMAHLYITQCHARFRYCYLNMYYCKHLRFSIVKKFAMLNTEYDASGLQLPPYSNTI